MMQERGDCRTKPHGISLNTFSEMSESARSGGTRFREATPSDPLNEQIHLRFPRFCQISCRTCKFVNIVNKIFL